MELLANKLRPTKLSEVIGQKHLVGENKVISNLVKNGKIFSMILYGKPGIGKTSIASAIISEFNIRSKFLNATTNNKADFDIAIEEAKMYGEMILVIDEIHRMNKDKQDILLPHIESGLIILIGLTTSNPYHKINPAIRSRCSIYELKELSNEDIIEGLKRALKELPDIKIDDEALNYIATLSSGDFRSALNTLEISYYATSDHNVTIEDIKNVNDKPVFFHDKNEDGHYAVLSAFQKSIRGSDVDASLHYLARLLVAGDLDSIYRRMSVIVYEDIGLANPGMGPKVMAAIAAAEQVGLPEAIIPLGVVVTELALSPKSNSAYLAINEAVSDINKGLSGSIPRHLINPSSDYLYPHNYKNDYVEQTYLPDKLKNKKYYHKKNNKYEMNLYKLYEEMRNNK